MAFVDPEVDKESRTVGVRVVLNNEDGLMRIGDYAKARIQISVGVAPDQPVYDPDLASKWISPRHPHIIRDQPGSCPLCGVELKSAAALGYTDQPQARRTIVVVPRSAVLNAANESVVYVETEPGRFEIRRVVTGATSGDDIVIVKGVAEGEQVATAGNFLLDSQMQFAGNPSLIDPTRAAPPLEMIAGFAAKELAEINQLPDEERSMAITQVICPVTDFKLGSMGVPPKVTLDGNTVFICCEGCREDLLDRPEVYLAKLESYKATPGASTDSQSESFDVPQIRNIEAMDEDAFPEIGTIELIESVQSDGIETQMPLDGDEGGNDP